MIKKTILSVGVLTLLGLFCFGRHASSYVRTSAGWIKDSVKQGVPLEFEIDRARRMVKDLVPDIRRNMHVIAQEEVEVDRLEQQIAQTEKTVEKERGEVLKLKGEVATGLTAYDFGGRTYTLKQVKCDLANRFERFKTHDATLGSLRDIQQARRRSLEAARQKLEGMLAAKRQLEVDVENLEARLKMVEVAQTTSAFTFDDSQLGRVKELIGDVRTRLNVAEKLVNAETKLQDEIPLTEPAGENIVEQVSEYFAPASVKVAEVETKK